MRENANGNMRTHKAADEARRIAATGQRVHQVSVTFGALALFFSCIVFLAFCFFSED
jgi:hypothetical protein